MPLERLNPGLLFGALVWLMQTLQLVSEMLCGFKENRFPLRNNGTIWNHIIEKSHFEMPLIQIS